MKEFLGSLKKSFAEAFSKNEYFIRAGRKYPRFFGFVRRRMSLSEFYGFPFTVGFLIGGWLLFHFFAIVQDVLTNDQFVEADLRIMNLVPAIRSVRLTGIFLFFTYLGNWQIIFTSAVLIAIIFWLLRKRREIALLAVSLGAGELFYFLFKLFIGRRRPDLAYSLISQDGYAFPSGHALMATIFYGMIIYFLCGLNRKFWRKILIGAFFGGVILFIGLSRVYLGVHWASDVVAGWFAGLAILIFLIALFGQPKEKILEEEQPIVSRGTLIVLGVIMLVFEAVFFFFFYTGHPLRPGLASPRQESSVLVPADKLIDFIEGESFPKFSESLVGDKMEPISFIVISSQEKLINVFRSAGWSIADRLGPRSLVRLAFSAIFGAPYPSAPVTPAFLKTEPESIAFEKPAKTASIARRHHARFWLTRFSADGIAVWVATASFDDGLRYLITHHIKPDIDTEREFIKDDLVKTGLIQSARQIQLVSHLLGTNAGGDYFFTDGKAYVLTLDG